MVFRCQMSNVRFQISDFRFQISDVRCQISDSDFGLRISDFRFQISDFKIREISDHRFPWCWRRFLHHYLRILRVSDFRFQISKVAGVASNGARFHISNFKVCPCACVQIAHFKSQCCMVTAPCEIIVSKSTFQISDCCAGA